MTKWIKLYINTFDNPKMAYIESLNNWKDVIIVWIKLLILAGECEAGGKIYVSKRVNFTSTTLSKKLRMNRTEVNKAVKELEILSMIEITSSYLITISNWERYQKLIEIDELEKRKEQGRARSDRFRKKHKIVTLYNVTVTLRNAIEKEKEIRARVRDKSKREDNGIDLDLKNDIDCEILVMAILEKWNDLNIMNHTTGAVLQSGTEKLEKIINAVSAHGFEKINEAMLLYHVVLNKNGFYWKHKYTLWDFLEKGVDRFLPDANPLVNFREKKWGDNDYESFTNKNIKKTRELLNEEE